MNLSALLSPDLVLVPLEAADKWTAIEALARAAIRAIDGGDALFAPVHDALVARERSMTTGMEHGVAIPHAAVDGIADPIAVMGIAPAGVPFESLDGEPARIIVCLVIPRQKKLLHIKTLAEIARLLGRETVRGALVAAATPAEVIEVVSAKEREPA